MTSEAFPTTYLSFLGLVPPGVNDLVIRPQVGHLRPRALRVEPKYSPARYFSILDVKAGNRSQFVQAQEVPALRFARDEEEDGVPFHCESLTSAMDFVMVVRNTWRLPLPFAATWTCDVLPEHYKASLFGYAMEPGELARRQAEERQFAEEQRARDERWKESLSSIPIGVVKAGASAGGVAEVVLGKDGDPAIERLKREAAPSAVAEVPRATSRSRVEREPAGFGWDPYDDD